MKEPDEAMAREGDGDIWRRMVDAALRARWDLDAALHGPAEAPPGGTDEEGDMPINAGDMQKKDPASWLQWSSGQEMGRAVLRVSGRMYVSLSVVSVAFTKNRLISRLIDIVLLR